MADETRGAPVPVAIPGAWARATAANDTDDEPPSSTLGTVGVAGSRAMRSMGYDPATRTLWVEWASGNTHALHDVPPELYEGLVAARSKGRYFQDHLRDRFVHERLR